MKRFNSAILTIALLFLASAASQAQESEVKVVDEVIAQVNDGVITLSRIKREMKFVADSLVEQGKTPEQARAEVEAKQGELIANIINEELLLQKGKELGAEADADVSVNQRFLEIMKQQNIKTLDALYEAMEQQGLNPRDVRENWRKQFIKDAVLQNEVDRKIYWQWKAAELKAYYEKNKTKFTKPETITLSEIFLSFAGRDENAVRDKAKQIVAQLRAGGDFAKFAVENSDREDVRQTKGAVGTLNAKELDPKFAEALKNVKKGGVSDPIELPEGIEILRIDDRVEASKDSFFDETEVRKAMTYEALPDERKKYLANLRGDSYIKINDTYRPLVSPLLFAEERQATKPAK